MSTSLERGEVLDWREVPVESFAAEMEELRDFVRWLIFRFNLDHRIVPPCWYRHGALVEVLSALRDARAYSFSTLRHQDEPARWHHTFITLETRLREFTTRTGCTPTSHRDETPNPKSVSDADWAEFVVNRADRPAG